MVQTVHDLYQERERGFFTMVHFFPELNGKRGIKSFLEAEYRTAFLYVFCYELAALSISGNTKWARILS